MKYLKLYENHDEITRICRKYGIKKWSVNPDGSIDVEGGVWLLEKNLTKLPFKFGKVSGDFICSHNKLTTLEGAPREVGGDFWCGGNNLTTLEGAPREVGGDFLCAHNDLTTLEGGPVRVGGIFSCNINKLTSLKGAPKYVGNIFCCNDNNIMTLEWFPLCNRFWCVGNPVYLIWNLFKDPERVEFFNECDPIHDDKIILDRLNYFLDVIDKPPVTDEQVEEFKKYYKIIE